MADPSCKPCLPKNDSEISGPVLDAAVRANRPVPRNPNQDSGGVPKRPPLIVPGAFAAASGKVLPWKIECDHFDNDDWHNIALVAKDILPPFCSVVGIPGGGLALAREIKRYATAGPFLFVDDVWTTGGSMRRVGFGAGDLGFVVFARGPLPPNVKALFHTEPAHDRPTP